MNTILGYNPTNSKLDLNSVIERIEYYCREFCFPENAEKICRDLDITLIIKFDLISNSYTYNGVIYLGMVLDIPDYRDVLYHEIQHVLYHTCTQQGDPESQIKKNPVP